MKKYEEPKVKLHELKSKNSMLAGSPPDVVNQSKELPAASDSSDDATQGFSTIDGWN